MFSYKSIFGEKEEYEGRVFLRSYDDALQCLKYLRYIHEDRQQSDNNYLINGNVNLIEFCCMLNK